MRKRTLALGILTSSIAILPVVVSVSCGVHTSRWENTHITKADAEKAISDFKKIVLGDSKNEAHPYISQSKNNKNDASWQTEKQAKKILAIDYGTYGKGGGSAHDNSYELYVTQFTDDHKKMPFGGYYVVELNPNKDLIIEGHTNTGRRITNFIYRDKPFDPAELAKKSNTYLKQNEILLPVWKASKYIRNNQIEETFKEFESMKEDSLAYSTKYKFFDGSWVVENPNIINEFPAPTWEIFYVWNRKDYRSNPVVKPPLLANGNPRKFKGWMYITAYRVELSFLQKESAIGDTGRFAVKFVASHSTSIPSLKEIEEKQSAASEYYQVIVPVFESQY